MFKELSSEHSEAIVRDSPIEDNYSPVEEINAHLEKLDHQRRLARAESAITRPEDQKFLMKDTGFNTAEQAAMYLKIKSQNPHLSNREINNIFADRTEQDIKGYYWEFLARQPVLINFLDLDSNEIVSSKTGQRLLEVINDDERSGAIKNAIEHLEDHLADAPANSLFAIHSPHGWAKDGFDDLPDDQIYLYKLDENKNLSAITLRLSMQLEDHEAILKSLVGEQNINNNLDIKSRLIQASNAIVYLDNKDFEDYVEIIQSQLKTNLAWQDKDKNGKAIRTHTFEDIKSQVNNLLELENIDEDIEQITKKLDKYLRTNRDYSDPKNLRKLIIKMGKAALDMQHALAVKNGYKGKKDYQKLNNRAQELGGCVASASSETRTRINANGEKEYFVRNCGNLNCKVELKKWMKAGERCPKCRKIFKGC